MWKEEMVCRESWHLARPFSIYPRLTSHSKIDQLKIKSLSLHDKQKDQVQIKSLHDKLMIKTMWLMMGKEVMGCVGSLGTLARLYPILFNQQVKKIIPWFLFF